MAYLHLYHNILNIFSTFGVYEHHPSKAELFFFRWFRVLCLFLLILILFYFLVDMESCGNIPTKACLLGLYRCLTGIIDGLQTTQPKMVTSSCRRFLYTMVELCLLPRNRWGHAVWQVRFAQRGGIDNEMFLYKSQSRIMHWRAIPTHLSGDTINLAPTTWAY